MSDAISTTYYRDALGGFARVELFVDTDAESPRTDSDVNLAELVTLSYRYDSPDKGRSMDDYLPRDYWADSIDTRRASRYIALFMPEILAYAWLNNSDSGLSSYGAGDVSGYVNGIAVVTRERYAEVCGLPDDADAAEIAQRNIAGEIDAYRAWQMGEYMGVVVSERKDGDWSEIESCWGFESDDAAMEFAGSVIGPLDDETIEREIDDAEREQAETLIADGTYTVSWTMEVHFASDPRDAARKALEIQRDPESIATVFVVNGQQIDLSDES